MIDDLLSKKMGGGGTGTKGEMYMNVLSRSNKIHLYISWPGKEKLSNQKWNPLILQLTNNVFS